MQEQDQRFGNWLRAAMEAAGVSMAQLAFKCDVTPAYISLLRSGSRHPSMEMVTRIASALQLDESAVLTEAGYPVRQSVPGGRKPKDRWVFELASLSASRPIDDILCATLDCLAERLPFDYGSICHVDWDSGEIDVLAYKKGRAPARAGSPEFIPRPWLIDRGITGYVATTGTIQRLADARSHPRYREGLQSTRAEMAVPLILSGEVVGVLNLESATIGVFGREHEQLVGDVVAILATSVVRTRDYAHLREVQQQLEGLRGLYDTTVHYKDEPALLEALALQIVSQFRDFDLCVIRMADPSKRRLLLRAVAHRNLTRVRYEDVGLRLPYERSLTGKALKGPIVVRDVTREADFRQAELARAFGLCGMIGAPIPDRDNRAPIGTIAVYTTSIDRRFQRSHQQLVSTIARYVSVVLNHRRTSLRLEATLDTASLCRDGCGRGALDRICLMICDKTGAKGASVFLLDKESGRLRLRGSTGLRGVDGYETVTIGIGEGKTGWVAKHGVSMRLIRDETLDELAEFKGAEESLRYVETTPLEQLKQGFLAVPIMINKVVVGVIRAAIGREDKLDFTPFDEDLLVEVSRQLALGLEAELERRRTEKIL